MSAFFKAERTRQIALRDEDDLYPKSALTPVTRNGREYPVLLSNGAENLHPSIATWVSDYFAAHRITAHRMLAHLLSSQACCLNMLAPFAHRPEALAALLKPAFPDARRIVPRKIPGEDGYVAFEWVDHTDSLGENKGLPPPRGANSTSTDGAVCLDVDGRSELVLIEWKYTEHYQPGLSGGDASNATRRDRYEALMRAPNGPIRADVDIPLDAFFHEPFYQLIRQQMLAWQVERKREVHGFDAVRVLHIAPAENEALRRVTSPQMQALAPGISDAFEIFLGLLEQPDRFIKADVRTLFGSFDAEAFGLGEWRAWTERRYPFAFNAV